MFGKGERSKKRRGGSHWVDGRPDVMQVTGQCKLNRPCAAANCRVRFAHQHRKPGASKHYGCGQSVRAGADNYGIVLRHLFFRARIAVAR
jgi:hypothetical protein